MEEQFIYRLASLETTVKERMRSLEEKFDNANKATQERRIETASEISALATRLSVVEKWQNAMTIRATLVAALILVFWTIFGDYLRTMIGTNV